MLSVIVTDKSTTTKAFTLAASLKGNILQALIIQKK
jgi:hypothetical protein